MPKALLCLGLLCLLDIVQVQTQKSLKIPPLYKVPLQPGFQANQFQGKWYAVGLAGNNVRKEEQGQFKMYATNYELQGLSYNVTSILFRNDSCDYWTRTFRFTGQRGHFKLANIQYYGLKSYDVRVVSTDYRQFAMVFFKKVDKKGKGHFKITLYGRNKELPSELKEKFTRFAKSLGLTDDYIIFPVPIDECIDQ